MDARAVTGQRERGRDNEKKIRKREEEKRLKMPAKTEGAQAR